jgi:motility quorum-sensing regulator / GCU-specific mRNA interferase toxin
MPDQPEPSHDLADVQAKVRAGFVNYRMAALRTAGELGFFRPDIDECILALCRDDFFKSMPALVPKWAGCWQDVYKPVFEGLKLYVKLQLFPGNRVYIVSFKRNSDD